VTTLTASSSEEPKQQRHIVRGTGVVGGINGFFDACLVIGSELVRCACPRPVVIGNAISALIVR